MALTTESFTSIHAIQVSGVHFGSLTPPRSLPLILLCPDCGVLSHSAPREWWRKCTLIVLHFLYSCIIGNSNLKIHIQKYPHTFMHQ